MNLISLRIMSIAGYGVSIPRASTESFPSAAVYKDNATPYRGRPSRDGFTACGFRLFDFGAWSTNGLRNSAILANWVMTKKIKLCQQYMK
jgi:hypothetical protein